MNYEEIAEQADKKIQSKAGEPVVNYIEGLEVVIGYLQSSLDAAKEGL